MPELFPRRAVLALLMLLLIPGMTTLAACDGDDDDGAGPQAPSTATATGEATEPPEEGGDGGGPQLFDDALTLETIEGLDSPTQIVFLEGNDALVAEKNGRIVRVTDGEVQDEPVLELAANYADERGVLGLTLHPDFASNSYVYVYWTWTGQGGVPDGFGGEPSDNIEQVPANGNRIDRFVWDGERLTWDREIAALPSKITDLTLDRRRGNHNGGVLRFGPDGKLYAVIGDQNVRGHLTNVGDGAPIEETGIAAAVLRLNDDGSVPDDNPFAAQGGDLAKVFAYGIRNSFGFDFESRTGALWIEINGQAAYDTIVRLAAGANAGWIQIMGPPERFDDYKALEIDTDRQLDEPSFPPEELASSADEALARLHLYPGAQYAAPQFSWRYAVAPAGFHFVRGAELGDAYEGSLLVGDVNTGSIWHLRMGADGALELGGGLADGVNDNEPDTPVGEMQGHLFGSGFFVATDIETAPDGCVWITSIANGAAYRICRTQP